MTVTILTEALQVLQLQFNHHFHHP